MSGTNGQTVPAGQPSYAELLAMVQKLQADANKPRVNTVEFVFADKGGISATAIGRFPTTLYAEQWLRLIAAIREQDLETKILTWLSRGERLLKGNKEEQPQSIMQRSIAFGVGELAKRVQVHVPAQTAQPVAPPASK